LLGNRPYLGLIGVNVPFNICTVFSAVALPVCVVRGLHAPLSGRSVPSSRSPRRLWAARCAAAALTVLLARGSLLVGCLTAMMLLLWAAAGMPHGPASNGLSAQAAPEGLRGTCPAAFPYSFATADMVTPGLFVVLYGVNRVLPWVVVGCLAPAASVVVRPLERRLTRGEAAAEVNLTRA